MSKTSENDWQIEVIFKKAFARTKDRFLSYFLSTILFWVATSVIAALVFLVGGGFIFLSGYIHNNSIITGTIAFVIALAFLLLFFYLAGWWGLAMIEIVIQNSKTNLQAAFKKTRPLVWSYIGTQAIMGLFILGLTPFIVLSLGVVAVLWGLWAVFVGFIFLEKGKKGLECLWYSRALYNKKFWPITGRIVLVTFVILIIQVVLGANKENSLHVISWIVSLFSTPFIISYNYELYKNLESEEGSLEVKPFKWWIGFSIVGGVILVVSLALFSYFAASNPSMMKYNQNDNKKQFRYNTVPSDSSSI